MSNSNTEVIQHVHVRFVVGTDFPLENWIFVCGDINLELLKPNVRDPLLFTEGSDKNNSAFSFQVSTLNEYTILIGLFQI